jgi:hypothetical protein
VAQVHLAGFVPALALLILNSPFAGREQKRLQMNHAEYQYRQMPIAPVVRGNPEKKKNPFELRR